jgi:hypothetical protein
MEFATYKVDITPPTISEAQKDVANAELLATQLRDDGCKPFLEYAKTALANGDVSEVYCGLTGLYGHMRQVMHV